MQLFIYFLEWFFSFPILIKIVFYISLIISIIVALLSISRGLII